MGTIKAEALLKLWKVEDLTVEQGLGHTLQHLVRLYQQVEQMTAQQHKLENAVAALNVSLANLRTDVDGLIAHTGLPLTAAKPRQQRGSRGKPQ